MQRLALMTIGVLHGPYGDPRVQEFYDRIDAVFERAEGSPGFLGRVPKVGLDDRAPWTAPARFDGAAYEGLLPATLSLWEDVETATAFSYRGVHADALRVRHDWFRKIDGPSHVAWWQPGDALPHWAEANERYERVWTQEGPDAFLLQRPFDSGGAPYVVDRERVRALAADPLG